ncbi:MAG: gliding motility-associated C-terminal domain-containing protein, partial [Bacteroidota bacterium]
SIQWSPGLFLNDSTSLNPVCTPLQSVVYEVTAANSLGCTSKTQVPVNVIDKIELDSMADMSVCALESFQLNPVLSVVPDASIQYNWTPAGFAIAPNNSNPVITGLNRTTTFQVIAGSGTCISDTATITVHVIKNPEMEVSEPVTTTPLAEVPLFASSRHDLSYRWTSPDELSCTDCRLTNAYPSQSQFVYVTGTDVNGCKATDSVMVTIVPCDPNAVFLPNIFSPNNDGLNDKFLLRSKILSSLSYFRVFNQWGEVVYETTNIGEGWDGTIKGQPAPVAVYVCSLGGKCDNGFNVTKSSNITLVR